jgi:hypothetical protein
MLRKMYLVSQELLKKGKQQSSPPKVKTKMPLPKQPNKEENKETS